MTGYRIKIRIEMFLENILLSYATYDVSLFCIYFAGLKIICNIFRSTKIRSSAAS